MWQLGAVRMGRFALQTDEPVELLHVCAACHASIHSWVILGVSGGGKHPDKVPA